MDKQRLIEIILDQKESYLNQEYIERQYNLDTNINYCFVGIRRCGKSFLMYQLVHETLDSGIDLDRILYINFQDERLLEFNYRDFDKLLEIALEFSKGKGIPYLFLDEIQLIDNWDKFARRVADTKYHISITGSNSKMLSSEMASTLGGRFMILNVFPYSFDEYLLANKANRNNLGLTIKSRAEISILLKQYLTYGAFPELVNIVNKKDYLNNIYQTIYLGDIITRNKIENSFALRLILKKIAEAIMKPISYSRLYGIVKSSGAEIGKQTIINYVNYSLDSLLIFQIQNYAAKLVEKETSPKYYFMDTGLLNIYGFQNPSSAQLENAVAIELVRRYGRDNVYYFEKNIEVDFYVPEIDAAIQVAYDVDDEETFKRETRSLIIFNKHFQTSKCLLLTMNQEKEIEVEGIKVEIKPIWKWLCEN